MNVSEAKIYSPTASHELPLFTVESTINLAYPTVMRSRYKLGKILLNARWERTSLVPWQIQKFPCYSAMIASFSFVFEGNFQVQAPGGL